MLLDAEVNRYIDRAPAVLTQNVESFLAQNEIGRAGLESFALSRFKGDFDLFYVSTVARGLAGSKSDLDLILVSDVVAGEGVIPSSMLFHAGRRAGVKLVNQRGMAESIAVLQEVSDRIAAGQFVSVANETRRIAVGWQDLERLINGVSFISGTRYLRHLPGLCRWAALGALQEFRQQHVYVRLALASENIAAASAYASGAVVSAMDAIMAACGQVQSNTKWTFERWRRFTQGVETGAAREAIVRVAEVRTLLARPLTELSGVDLDAAIGRLQTFVSSAFVPSDQVGNVRFDISPGAHRDPFLPGADSICGPRLAAVADVSILDRILTASNADLVMSDGAVARHTLSLLQAGALCCNLDPVVP